jgi:TetR/AcrR family transcriptional regulator, tetracycline repressor protein
MYSLSLMESRSPGQRAGLTRKAVVDAARRIAEEEGLDRLSMRTLAVELGVRPNALYSHVDGKEGLLDALLDDLLAEVHTPALDDWRASLMALLHSTRCVLLSHPGLIDAFLSRPTRGPNAMHLGETCLGLLAEGGIEGEQAARAFRSLLIYTLGFAAYEAPRAADPDRPARARAGAETFRQAGPLSSAAASELAAMPADEDFNAALGWMLDGVLREVEDQPEHRIQRK